MWKDIVIGAIEWDRMELRYWSREKITDIYVKKGTDKGRQMKTEGDIRRQSSQHRKMQNKFTTKGERSLSIWLYLFHHTVHVQCARTFDTSLLNEFRNNLSGNFVQNLYVLVSFP
jgi:hypothetical protein